MTTDEPSVIEIPFTNQGGASRGVAIEISGPAFQSGLVRTTRAKVGDVETMLESKPGAASVRGELGELAMEAGFTPIGGDKKGALPPPAAPSLYLRIEVFWCEAGERGAHGADHAAQGAAGAGVGAAREERDGERAVGGGAGCGGAGLGAAAGCHGGVSGDG